MCKPHRLSQKQELVTQWNLPKPNPEYFDELAEAVFDHAAAPI